jgi:hypothetical protein
MTRAKITGPFSTAFAECKGKCRPHRSVRALAIIQVGQQSPAALTETTAAKHVSGQPEESALAPSIPGIEAVYT